MGPMSTSTFVLETLQRLLVLSGCSVPAAVVTVMVIRVLGDTGQSESPNKHKSLQSTWLKAWIGHGAILPSLSHHCHHHPSYFPLDLLEKVTIGFDVKIIIRNLRAEW